MAGLLEKTLVPELFHPLRRHRISAWEWHPDGQYCFGPPPGISHTSMNTMAARPAC